MFDFPTGSCFGGPWGRPGQQMGQARPWDACSFPWFEAEDAYSRAHGAVQQTPASVRHKGHRKSRSLPDEYFRPAAPRPQQAANGPEPHAGKPRTVEPVDQTHSSSRPQAPESSSSYYSTETETVEPMDVCSEPRPAGHHRQQQQKHRQQQHRHAQAATQPSFAASSATANGTTATAKSNTHAYAATTGREQQQKKQKQQHAAPAVRTRLNPAAAATVIQAAWRMHRLSRHRQSLKQLSSAAAELRRIAAQLKATQEAAAAAGVSVTQKQYLELSEPVMRVLFQLDSISCGSAAELRSMRKQLSASANKLLDDIQAAHKGSQAVQQQ